MVKVPFIIGPTAIGKTRVALAIAEKIPIEIISADSRQIYRYLNIGTAKPSKRELSQVKHHLIDFLRPDEYFSAGMFSRIGRKIVKQILAKEKTPLVVGGSGLYINALVDGFFSLEVRDEKVRNSLRKRVLSEGVEVLYEELTKIDPVLADKIRNKDKQRIIRGLEVYLVTGQPLSKLQETQSKPADFKAISYGLNAQRSYLYHCIDQRVDKMISQGLLSEVAGLKRKGFSPKLNSLNTVGYKEVFHYMDNQMSYDEMLEAIKRNTRHYAKRQLTWFKRNPEIKWFSVDEKTNFSSLAEEIIADFKSITK
jgi:tRNA dimethylallyltransferase